MKKKALLTGVLLLSMVLKAGGPWKMQLTNKEEQMDLKLDLYEESIDVPGMELFGPMNGFLAGKGVYGTWMVTSFQIKNEKEATLRLSNDQGSETQSIQLTWQNDSTYMMELKDGVVVKKVVNKKLVKIPARIVLNKLP
ncbi:MAG: hypothetical protein J6Y04_08150 [Bacteroidaceae bacterium]|nr:hypothetical protein [Bacteroidaceae bacterium]